MENVLITGATGFLGSSVIESLIRSGYKVRALVRRPSVPALNDRANVELVMGDICQPDTLLSAVEGVDYVIHCAGLVKAHSQNDFFKVNVKGTENLLQAISSVSPPLKRFVHVSSLAAAGPNVGNQPDVSIENANPVSDYGNSKLDAERVLEKYHDRWPITVVRPPAIYGPGDRECLLLFKLVKSHFWPSFLSKEKRLSLIYVDDAADVIIRAVQKDQGSGRCYFIDDGCTYKIQELVDVLKVLLKTKRLFTLRIPLKGVALLLFIAEKYAAWAKKPAVMGRDKFKELVYQDWTCNSQLARQKLDWSASTNWEAGALKTLKWYQQQGWM